MRSPHFASVAMFAEDIRVEDQGIFTIIGIMPDNISYNVEGNSDGSPHMQRLAIFVRTIIATDADFSSGLMVNFQSPGGQLVAENPVSPDFLYEQRDIAVNQNSPHITLISQFKMSPFPILEHGKFFVTSKFGKEEYIAGFLNILKPD